MSAQKLSKLAAYFAREFQKSVRGDSVAYTPDWMSGLSGRSWDDLHREYDEIISFAKSLRVQAEDEAKDPNPFPSAYLRLISVAFKLLNIGGLNVYTLLRREVST